MVSRYWHLSYSFCVLLMIGAVVTQFGFGQQKSDFAGEYDAMLGPLHVKLHIVPGANDSLSATVDSPDQGLFALQCTDLAINGRALSFSVPNVHGEWTGILSGDKVSLSGVWKQDRPMALDFTRKAEGSGGRPSVPTAKPETAAPAPTAATTRPPCTTMFGVSYWDGSAWKPMVGAAHLGADHGVSLKDGLKNPFSHRAGITNIITFKNPAANLTLEATPVFCVAVPANFDPSVVMIGALEVKKDHRELETCNGPCASRGRNSDDWMPQKRVQPVEIKRVSDTAVEITPKDPLKTGQYILGGPPLVGFNDFGVR